MIPYKQITIDLVPECMPPEPLLTASQYDNGRPVEVTVQYGGQDYDLTGMAAKIQVRKPSGKVVIANAAQVSGSKVTFNLITQMTAEHGQVLMEISLIGGGQDPIGTANWLMQVERSPLAAGDPSATWVVDLNQAVQDAEDAQDAAEDAAERAEQSAAVAGYMFFHIDERGHLIYEHTTNVDVEFYLYNGHLYVGVDE